MTKPAGPSKPMNTGTDMGPKAPTATQTKDIRKKKAMSRPDGYRDMDPKQQQRRDSSATQLLIGKQLSSAIMEMVMAHTRTHGNPTCLSRGVSYESKQQGHPMRDHHLVTTTAGTYVYIYMNMHLFIRMRNLQERLPINA